MKIEKGRTVILLAVVFVILGAMGSALISYLNPGISSSATVLPVGIAIGLSVGVGVIYSSRK